MGDLLISQSEADDLILSIRNHRVVLDSNLAKLFGVETKRLNEQVKRNAKRFGENYCFGLPH